MEKKGKDIFHEIVGTLLSILSGEDRSFETLKNCIDAFKDDKDLQEYVKLIASKDLVKDVKKIKGCIKKAKRVLSEAKEEGEEPKYDVEGKRKIYFNVVKKWLQFCYGLNQKFATEECVAALVALSQLDLKEQKGKEWYLSSSSFYMRISKSSCSIFTKNNTSFHLSIFKNFITSVITYNTP